MATRYIGDANSQNKFRGSADGVAPAAGYIGEVRYGQPGSAVNFGAHATTTNITSVSLSKGTWLISGYVSFNITSGTLTGAYIGLSVNPTDMESNTYLNGTAPSNFNGASNMVTPIRVITVTADNTPHYLNGLLYYSAATGNYATVSRLTAIRIG